MSVRVKLNLVVDGVESVANVGAGNATAINKHLFELAKTYANGTGANQQDKIYSTTQTVNGNTDINLTTATNEETGTAISLASVSGFIVYNHSTTSSQTVTVGGAPSNPFITWLIATGDGNVIGPGGVLIQTSPVDGWAVTASTADILRIATSASLTFTVIVWGQDT